MATTPATRLLTAEEFLEADLGDGTHELVRGEVVAVSPPLFEHGAICHHISGLFWDYARRTGHGHGAANDPSIRTRRDPDTVRGPDFVYFSHARWRRPRSFAGLPPVAPDLAVEVVSPGNRRGEILEKVAEYLEAGTLLVWVVYPRSRTIVIHRSSDAPPVVLTDGEAIEGIPELPDFRCMVSEVFDG